MPEPSADRNMLVGILALQLGFITRGALIAAVTTWVLDKNKLLGQILREQEALDADTFALLEALEKKHLARHGDDAGKSLEALSSLTDDIRRDLGRITDAEVQASVAQAGTGAATVDHLPRTTASVSVGASTSKGLRFRVIRPHAKGGLGLVYFAHDAELNREVALKEIQDRHADDQESRTRFLLEAEITGGLEHPGIVPVYGLGQYADGRPFYAMRFIRGDSLKDAIVKFHADGRPLREKTLELRELLERLIDVCNAIQYAHDRGVLHRDLKPGNIMLGRYGETLVVDWGLAKSQGADEEPGSIGPSGEPLLRPASASGSAETIQGSAIGTPQYMSPEQAAGRTNELGPASDIYSLGATLYSLLTGKAPIEDSGAGAARKPDLGHILAKVQAGAIQAPRQINPGIDRALEAICLKAMALKPEDRYRAPNEMVDDLKHWLADEPVGAWREPLSVKTRRWVGKHRTLVTGVGAAVLVGVVSLAAATVLLAQANDVIQTKNNDLTAANSLIKTQNEEIKKEVNEKEKQRKLAESRLKQSLDAVGLFANDARKYCEDAMVPGGSRRRLYEVLITQLERQVDQEPGEASIDSLHNKLWMYQTLCAVTHDFGEHAENKKWFDRGLASLKQWDTLRPADPTALGFRATLLNLRGNSLTALRKLDSAKALYAEALAIRRKLAGDPDVDLPGKVEAVGRLADSLDSLEQFEEAIALRAKICALHEKDQKRFEAEKNVEKLRDLKDRAFAYREALCWTYQKAGFHASDYPTRKKYLTKADEMSEELMGDRATPRNVLLRWSMIVKILGELEYNHGKLAEKERKTKEAEAFFDAAKKHYEKYNRISQKLATSNELIDGLREYSRSFYTLGLAEEHKGAPAEARKQFQMSWDIRRQTFHDYAHVPMSSHLQIDLLFSQLALGDVAKTMEKTEDMILVFTREPDAEYRLACVHALAIDTIAQTRKPLTAADERSQMRYRFAAFKCLRLAHDGGFTDFFQTNIDADFDAIRDDPAMKEFEATYQYRLGVLAKKRGEAKEARAQFEKAQDLAEQFLKALPKDARDRHVKAVRLCARVQLGAHAEAVAEADKLREGRSDAAVLFLLARVYALASAATDDLKLKERYRTQAMDALEKASAPVVGLGVPVVTEARLVEEEDLDALRGDGRFKEILERVKKQER